MEDSTLDVLKDLLSRHGEGYAINNPLRIKVPESDLLSDTFNSGDAFPSGFDGTSATDMDDGPTLVASAFTTGDKVAVQVWFGSYNFNNKAGPTFRLLNYGGYNQVFLDHHTKAGIQSLHVREEDDSNVM